MKKSKTIQRFSLLLICLIICQLQLQAQWVQVGQDIDGVVSFEWSGHSVATNKNGDRVVVGSYFTMNGRARVYKDSSGVWVQIGSDIEGEAVGDHFGFSVSISDDGSRIAVGADRNDGGGFDAGHTRVFEEVAGQWVQVGQDIDGEFVNSWSGYSVSLSANGKRVVIGAPNINDHVRVFEEVAGQWVKIGQTLTISTWHFGKSVSINADGTKIVIGEPSYNVVGYDQGRAMIFEYSGGSWVQVGSDIDGETPTDNCGNAVSISASGHRVSIAANKNYGIGGTGGHVRIFEDSSGNWIQVGNEINGEAGGDQSGTSVSISDDGKIVAIGAPRNDGNGTSSGHARIYKNVNDQWIKFGQDIDGEMANDNSGTGVSISGNGDRVIVGAPYNNGGISSGGHARVFEVDKPDNFITTWQTHDSTISIPATGTYHIKWENLQSGMQADSILSSHTVLYLPDTGVYRITIDTGLHRIHFNNADDGAKLLSIDQWGDIQWISMKDAFLGCNNLTLNAIDVPDLSSVSSTVQMFRGCTKLIGDSTMNSWDMSNVKDMGSMFYQAKNFNAIIGDWQIDSVENLTFLFFETDSFNQDIGNWNTSSVKEMRGVFYKSKSFNQDIGNWLTDSVNTMASMFRESPVFNQNISTWNTSRVTDMSSMFELATSFNQDIGNWDVSHVTKMTSMFAINPSFNQNLSSWNVGNVNNFDYTFTQAVSFNHNLGGWDVSQATTMYQMLSSSGLDLMNYDSTLIGWAILPVLNNVVLGAYGMEYCAGKSARDSLIQAHNWTITGDEFIGENKWTGLGDGTTWEDDNNWSRGHQPLDFEIAKFDLMPPMNIYLSSNSATANSLEILNGNSLTINSLGVLNIDGTQGCGALPGGINIIGFGSKLINNGSLLGQNAIKDQMNVNDGAEYHGDGILETN